MVYGLYTHGWPDKRGEEAGRKTVFVHIGHCDTNCIKDALATAVVERRPRC